MGTSMRMCLLVGVMLLPVPVLAAVQEGAGEVVLTTAGCRAAFSAANGGLLSLSQPGRAGSILGSGEQGLWRVRFRDRSTLDASAFSAASAERSLRHEADPAEETLRFIYSAAELAITVTVRGTAEGLDLQAEVTPGRQVVLDLALPGRLRFAPDQLQRFIMPGNGNLTVGSALNARFFGEQPQDRPSGWQPEPVGAAGYAALFGGPLDQRADQDPAVGLRATAESVEWLGEALVARLAGTQTVVNRPCTRTQADLVLADSDNGPYFSASGLGGQGRLWRIGGGVGEGERGLAQDLVVAAMERLAGAAPAGRRKLGLVALDRGPEAGGWTTVTVGDWRQRLRASRAVTGRRVEFVELTTVAAMLEALRADDFLAILNPYGEWAPVPAEGGMEATVAAVGRYVRAGGDWFEVGGYPFFYALRPLRYLTLGSTYPPAFADFMHLDTASGSASVYGVQPLVNEPWAAARDRDRIFVPGRLDCGGEARGGWLERSFATYVEPGQTWRSPVVRLVVGQTAEEGLAGYCEANGVRRRLAEKMEADTLGKLKSAVLVYYGGNAQDKTECASLLPTPTLVHFADYLKGGFDKEYPDHLPPRPSFGTAEELRRFFDRCHGLGHLVMPYTNPTWWCDHPRGPTFAREGDAPLLRDLEGKPVYERYAANDGWTVCHWHPAVRAANRETVRQFSAEYPVDVLFQDQCGARGWQYDANPASPTPYAYVEGLVSMVAEDSRLKPLSTEGGWDRVANYESQLCGMTWALVPTTGAPSWRYLMKQQYPPNTWTVYPLAQYVAHDKAAMVHHDLGQFVTNREVLAWTLGLGFGLSYRVSAPDLRQPAVRQWLLWLDRLQKSVCARYVGEPVGAFAHERGAAAEDDGVLRAEYGPVRLVANVGPAERREGEAELPGYGFRAEAPGMVAGNLAKLGGMDFGEEGVCFVTEGNGRKADVWVYAPGGEEVCVEVPAGMAGPVRVAFDGRDPLAGEVTGGTLRVRLPAQAEVRRAQPPAEVAGKAPRDWPGPRPAIGVLDLGLTPTWTRLMPDDWVRALSDSRLVKEGGPRVERVKTVEAMLEALAAGPRQWLAIINPYGEVFPAAGAGRWRETLEAIRGYVDNGGCWWETGGFSLYVAAYPTPAGWATEAVGAAGVGHLGLPVGGGEVDAPAEALGVTAEGREWLGAELAARVEAATSAVNRGAPRGNEDPGHVTLVAGQQQDFIAGYRLGGWGWLWRIGGFYPNPEVALPVAVAALEHLYAHPPLPVRGGGARYLWHATVEAE